jgi:hypothetical protein
VGVKPGFTLRSKMLPTLVVGFTTSALAVFALAHVAGSALRSSWALPTNLVVAIGLAVFAAIDVAFPRARPSLLRRQTPRHLTARVPLPVAGFLWGLDTGSVFSTFRASAASWAALVLVFAGWGPWWTGIAYAAAFCVPLCALVATYPVAGPADDARGWRQLSTEAVVVTLGDNLKYAHLAAVTSALVAVALALHGVTG